MENTFEITLRGASFSDVVAQARALVTEADKFQTKSAAAAPATKKQKTAPVIEDSFLDEEAPTDELDFADEEETPAPKKKTKTKIEEADIQKAAVAYAKAHNRDAVYKILKKFKVKSVLELKPAQYEDVMEALSL